MPLNTLGRVVGRLGDVSILMKIDLQNQLFTFRGLLCPAKDFIFARIQARQKHEMNPSGSNLARV